MRFRNRAKKIDLKKFITIDLVFEFCLEHELGLVFIDKNNVELGNILYAKSNQFSHYCYNKFAKKANYEAIERRVEKLIKSLLADDVINTYDEEYRLPTIYEVADDEGSLIGSESHTEIHSQIGFNI